MRLEFKRKQREEKRLDTFWRRNKTFPMQFGGDEETPDAEEMLSFWRSVSNKEVTEARKGDKYIREVLSGVKR